ncbi:hypothetical protein [Hamadaea tsunoensis]|uniref:hypothetical protein n=1 Tax=Hamadaea tsunoensis TaxID=53368 RepID=UPI0004167986|nr:hypothetical protein [Hamadaea tsunoensis]
MHVLSRRTLLTTAVAAAGVVVGLPAGPASAAGVKAAAVKSAAGAPAGPLLAVAGLGCEKPGLEVVYGYRILAPVGAYRSAADGTLAVADVLRAVQGNGIVLVNGVAAELRRGLAAATGTAWQVGYPVRGSVPAKGWEVIAFVRRTALGTRPAAVAHPYALPSRYA